MSVYQTCLFSMAASLLRPFYTRRRLHDGTSPRYGPPTAATGTGLMPLCTAFFRGTTCSVFRRINAQPLFGADRLSVKGCLESLSQKEKFPDRSFCAALPMSRFPFVRGYKMYSDANTANLYRQRRDKAAVVDIKL